MIYSENTILLAADEASAGPKEKSTLQRSGYTVIAANTGQEALEIVRNRSIDLVLMDTVLGDGMAGTDAARKIFALKNIPIVFLFSDIDAELVDRAEAISSYGYAVKQSDPLVLAAAIKMAFRLHETRKALSTTRKEMAHTKALLKRGEQEEYIANTFEWQQREDALRAKAEYFQQSIVNSPIGILEIDKHMVIRSANAAMEELTGYSNQDLQGKTPFDFLNEAQSKLLKEEEKKPPENRTENYFFRIQNKAGESHAYILKVTRILDGEGDFCGYFVYFLKEDEVEPLRSELNTRLKYGEALYNVSRVLLTGSEDTKAIQKALSYMRRTAQVGRVYIFENFYDPNDGLCMRQTYETCAPGVHAEIDNPVLQKIPYAPDFQRWHDKLEKNIPVQGVVQEFPPEEQDILRSQGIQSILVLPIRVDGQFFGFIGFDDTEKEQKWDPWNIRLLMTAAEMIGSFIEQQKNISEKKALYAELQHRIKNSLAKIVGFIYMEKTRAKNDETQLLLRNLQNRVMSISNLYSLLYEKGDIAVVDFDRYCSDIIASLKKSFLTNESSKENKESKESTIKERTIKVRASLQPMQLKTKKAISLGLLVTELLTNAFKYAFPETDKGEISITIYQDQEAIYVQVWDNGIGFADQESGHRQETARKGLGLNIVRSIIKQMSGSIVVDNENGTQVDVQIPLETIE